MGDKKGKDAKRAEKKGDRGWWDGTRERPRVDVYG